MEKTKRIYPHRPYIAIANLSKISDEQKEKVKELYLQGSSQLLIEKTLGMTRKTIRTILKKAGIDRTKSEQWRKRWGSSLNEDAFDVLTPEACYWIGFLYADGHIRKEGSESSIEVEIELKDKEHLIKLAKFVGSNKEPKQYSDNSCTIRFYSKKMQQRLRELGLSHDKSYTAKPHYLLKDSPDFWRGVVDGDGSLSNQLNCALLHLCGTEETITSFINYLNINGLDTKAIARFCKGTSCLHQVNFSCKKGIYTANLLYKDASVYLDRKYKTYLEWTQK
jgi:hypothetical protein